MNKDIILYKSIDYILNHFQENIRVQDVADHVYLSKYYFCRTFKEVTGESVYSFIKRTKIEQSAIDIKLQKERSLSEIGLDYGYSASNYSSLFKQAYHVTPETFRDLTTTDLIDNPFQVSKIEQLGTFDYYQKNIQIKKTSAFFSCMKEK